MAALDFPASPAVNDTYTSGSVTWTWDGVTWVSSASDVYEPKGKIFGVNTQTGSTYTLVLTDAGKVIEMNNASSNTLTIPPHSSVAFDTGARIDLLQLGAGQTTIAAGAGVTIRSYSSRLKLFGQYSGATLYQRGTSNEWVLIGDLSA